MYDAARYFNLYNKNYAQQSVELNVPYHSWSRTVYTFTLAHFHFLQNLCARFLLFLSSFFYL